MKINCIIFGLSGLDTAPIVRHMRKRNEFEKIVWFGTFNDADINTFDAYKFHSDYDYSINLPEAYLECMQQALGNFLISSSRRNETYYNNKTYTLGFGSTYGYLHHFSRYCYLIYELITKNNINLIIIDGLPHTSIDILLCQAAKFFKIKTLFLYQPSIANKFMYFSELNGKGVNFSLYYSDQHRPLKNQQKTYLVKEPDSPFYMRDFSDYFYDQKKICLDLISTFRSRIQRKLFKLLFKSNWFIFLFAYFFYKTRKNPKTAGSLAALLLKTTQYKIYESNLAHFSTKTVDLNTPYVYFPLNFQPELTTECLADHYTDILSAIEKLRCLLPENWKIYVKDHVVQYEIARDQIFFDRLAAIPNTVLIDRFYSSFELIKNSQFVATINGTAGWEAIHMGKKTLNFGNIYYQELPGVVRYNPNIALSDLLNITIIPSELEDAINNLINRMETGVVNADYSAAVENFDEEENSKIVCDFICKFFLEEKNHAHLNKTQQKENVTI